MLLPSTTRSVVCAVSRITPAMLGVSPAAAAAAGGAGAVRHMSIDQIKTHLPVQPKPAHQPQTGETPRRSWKHLKVPKYPSQETQIEDYEVILDAPGEQQAHAEQTSQKETLPYGVRRSRQLDLHPATQQSRELPVYVKYQKIRSRTHTIIKHIYGDVEAMEKDLRETLPSLKADVLAGPTEGQQLRAKHFGVPVPPLTTATYGYLGVGFSARGNRGAKAKKGYGGKPHLDVPKWIQDQVHPDVLQERSGKIFIRGNRVSEVKEWLAQRGF